MRVGIVGSRRRDTESDLVKCLQVFQLLPDWRTTHIISGGCPQGGDRFAEVIAKRFGLTITIHYPDWKGRGKSAGFYRNSFIARNADLLIAVCAPDRTGGTEDTVRKFLVNHPATDLILV